jgi:hypothetical protein
MDITASELDRKRAPGHLCCQGLPTLRWALFEAAQVAYLDRSQNQAEPDHFLVPSDGAAEIRDAHADMRQRPRVWRDRVPVRPSRAGSTQARRLEGGRDFGVGHVIRYDRLADREGQDQPQASATDQLDLAHCL